MILVINPAVCEVRRVRFRNAMLAHAGGGLIGGIALGTVSYVIGRLVPGGRAPDATAVIWTIAILLLITIDVGLIGLRIPSTTRQVPEQWTRTMSPVRYAFVFGIGLGIAFGTRIRFGSTYAVVLLAIVAPGLPIALLLGAGFGLGRVLVVASGAGARTAAGAQQHALRIRSHTRVAGVAAGLVDLLCLFTAWVWLIR